MPETFSVSRFTHQLYFDHNATTPLAPEVRRAMGECQAWFHGNPSSLHTPGREARGLIDQARRAIADLLGCGLQQVFFTSGGTEGNNLVIKGVFAAAGKGHIITSLIEHESVLGACSQVERAGGAVTYLPAGPDGRVRPDDVRRALRPDTVLISIMHANNETGAIQPVAAIGRLAREAGVPFHTDAVQTFGKLPTRVDEIGCDFLTLTAHKINGPKGAGAVFVRQPERLVPLISGGDQEQRLRAGTEGTHQIVGLGTAARLAAERREREYQRLRRLRNRLCRGLRRVAPDAIINGAHGADQLPNTVNVTFPGRSGLRVLAGLDCHEIGVSIGSACTADRVEPSHVLLGMGISVERALSTIRISMGTTTTMLAVAYLLFTLRKVLAGDPPGFAYLDPQHLTPAVIRDPATLLIDVRFPHERLLTPSIPGAVEWSVFTLGFGLPTIPRDRKVIFMCSTGIISTGAGYRLANAGHPHVRVVFGGYTAWRALFPPATANATPPTP